MKKNRKIKILLGILFLLPLVFSACQNELLRGEDVSVSMSLDMDLGDDGAIDPSNLSYTLCLFEALIKKDVVFTDADFKCKETKTGLTMKELMSYSFKVSHAEKGKFAYRLFVHATPRMKAETRVNISETMGFDQFEIQMIEENGEFVPLSKDNYYDYQTLDEDDLSGVSFIQLKLRRLVGRLVFDIFKSNSDLTPIDIAPGYGSTLDRVTRIDMQIKGITTGIKPSGGLVRKGDKDTTSLLVESVLDTTYHLNVGDQNPDFFLPVQKQIIVGSDTTIIKPAGGVRLFSVYLLPTGLDKNELLKAHLIFSYRDEYAKQNIKKIELNLPSSSSSSYLRVAENCFTLTNIRLKNNRIIDLTTTGDIDITTEWDKD